MTAPRPPTYAYLRRMLRAHRVELRIAVDLLEDHGLSDDFQDLVEQETGNSPHWLGICPHMDEPDSAPDPEVALQLEVRGPRAEAADQRAFIAATQTLAWRPRPAPPEPPAPEQWTGARVEHTILFYAPIVRIAFDMLAERGHAFRARVEEETRLSFWFVLETQNLALQPGRRVRWTSTRVRHVIFFYRDMMRIVVYMLAERVPAFHARVEAETGSPFRGDHGVES